MSFLEQVLSSRIYWLRVETFSASSPTTHEALREPSTTHTCTITSQAAEAWVVEHGAERGREQVRDGKCVISNTDKNFSILIRETLSGPLSSLSLDPSMAIYCCALRVGGEYERVLWEKLYLHCIFFPVLNLDKMVLSCCSICYIINAYCVDKC